MQPTTAIVYASSTGHTRKIAEYMAGKLGADLFDLKKQTMIDMKTYKTVILGTGIHFGKPYGPMDKFIEANKAELSKKKTGLFLCCMYDDEKGKIQCEGVSEKFGIGGAVFFSGKGEKNEDGFEKAVDNFIAKMH